jgi:hypothetical protein
MLVQLVHILSIYLRSIFRVFESLLRKERIGRKLCCFWLLSSAHEEPCKKYDESEGRDAAYDTACYGADRC